VAALLRECTNRQPRIFLFVGELVMLGADLQAEILSLYFGKDRSIRSIAEELGLNRKSVARVVQRRAVAEVRMAQERKSILDPYKPLAKELLLRNPKITGVALMNRLREEGFMGGKSVFNRWLQTVRSREPRKEAFLRLEFQAGECAQVDWGEFGDVFGDGIKIHAFIMVLAFSRLLYVEFTRSERFEDFIRCHENAFRFFGGVPRECWYDNLATAVTERLGKLVRFNARFFAYMGHHQIRPHACNPAKGNEKGRVEDGVKFIRYNFWPGREFKDFADLQAQAIVWMNSFCNEREHRATRRVPRLYFEAEEKIALLPLNPHNYDTDEVLSRVVPPDFHILFETNRYSVPWTLVGMTVTLRINNEKIRVFYNERAICSHARSYRKHQVISVEQHKAGLLERKGGNTSREAWQLAAVKNIGPSMVEYIKLLRSGQRSLRHELSRLLALSTIYGPNVVHSGCQEMLNSGVVGVNNLEIFLRTSHRDSSLQPEPISFQNQRLNRMVPVVDLRRYDALLFESHKSSAAEEDENGSDN
jgi:transposase